MSGAGSISFTLTGGTAGAVTVVGGSGAPIPDGNYQINVNVDNSGTTVSVATPLGAAQNSDIRNQPTLDA